MGGVERQFISAHRDQPTVLGFHGTYERNTGKLVDRPVDYFLSMSDGRMSNELAKSFSGIENNNGALYFMHRAQRSSETQALAYFCAGEEVDTRRDEQCVNRTDIDAVSASVLTTWELRDVPAPSFQPTRRQFERGVTIKAWE